MDDLHDYNRKALHEKISKVKTIRDTYRANEMIDVLSSAPDRDKGIINNYDSDEVLIRRIQCKGVTRMTRFFTLKGIARYLHEGRVFSYKNACSFFNVQSRDLVKEKLISELDACTEDNCLYNTKKLLKWLYEKRKSAKILGESCKISDVLEFATDDMIDLNADKIKLLQDRS